MKSIAYEDISNVGFGMGIEYNILLRRAVYSLTSCCPRQRMRQAGFKS
jgi:hypothetical protein